MCLSAVIYLFIVTVLQWHLALISHLHPAETADTSLADIHQHPPTARRSKNRCQRFGPPCSAWHQGWRNSQIRLGLDLATASCRRSPPFIAQVSRTLMNQCDLPLTLSWEMNWRGMKGAPPSCCRYTRLPACWGVRQFQEERCNYFYLTANWIVCWQRNRMHRS